MEVRRTRIGALVVSLSALGAPACSGEARVAGTAGGGPVYALMSQVYTDDGRTVYIAATHSIDTGEVSLDGAHEFPGVANFEAIAGRLLVSSGDAPIITAYEIDDALDWHEGQTVSFAAFPLEDNANFFYQYLVDEHHMYMPFDGYKRIVWDPTELEIETVLEDTRLVPERNGMPIEAAGNRSGIRYPSRVMMPFFYHDEDWYEFAPVSPIAVYDPQTHEESKVIEAPCAGLAIASQDEQGNTYFSSWDYGPLLALYGLAPPPCVARITADHELDESFTSDLTQWTGGRFAINFRYIRDGWGLANVFHQERLGVDFTGGSIDAAVQDQVWEEENWSVWRIDLANQEAHPFEAVDLPSFGWGLVEIDGRSILTVPYADSSRTKFYELDGSGNASELLDVVGDATWIRVR
jgi:hypothetical protein